MSTNHHHPAGGSRPLRGLMCPEPKSVLWGDFLSPPALLPPPQQEADLFHFFLLLNGQPLACGPDIKEAVALS